MVNTDFYKHTRVWIWDKFDPLGKRIKSLLADVVEKLPDEEQFKIRGEIRFETRRTALEFWQEFRHQWGRHPDFGRVERDGNCEWSFSHSHRADHRYIITIIVDCLASKTDDYIKGLIVHELSEMSYPYRKLQENWDSLQKMKPRARQVMMDKLTKSTSDAGPNQEYLDHEKEVNNEARRLGFQKEIDALEES